ncbi:MAG: 3-dehydroquinate synthase [Alphaproteobacteria bacterium]|nr:3-dehydroquinate synthase [Alphaproteobacteria bacterium]
MIEIEHCQEDVKTLLDRPIVLVGMMGVGKTTVGRLLASRLGWSFYDTDDEIVRLVGKSISDIFSEDGEPAFRELERTTIKHLLSQGPCIISSGGGGFTVPETTQAIKERSLALWMDAPIHLLVDRTKSGDRPLLKHGNPEDVLQNLLDRRRVYYAQAHVHVLDDGLTPEEMANRVLLQIREYLYDRASDQEKESFVPDAMCMTVTVTDRSYPIFIGSGLIKQPELWLAHELQGRDAFIITDYNVRERITDSFVKTLKPLMKSVSMMELAPGEQTKSFERYQAVLEWMIDNGVKRDSVVFAVGGGVIGDLAGFAAATIMRGVDFIQVPTTLLSQVDSSVGGKAAINSKSAKNIVGTFYQPRTVVIDLDTLMTLPRREWLSGYAEIVKYGLIGDEAFFEWLGENGALMLDGNLSQTMRAIETGCHKKAEIVAKDEKEKSGERALLNFGHTFAHALEANAGYDGTLLHGEAVSIGMVLAARLSQRLGYLAQDDVDKIYNHLHSLGLKTEIRDVGFKTLVTVDDLISAMKKDKKTDVHGLKFVILKRIGDADLESSVDEALVVSILEGSM